MSEPSGSDEVKGHARNPEGRRRRPPAMTDREAITVLSALVARLACGCWADLGTTESRDITERADSVFKAMLEKQTARRAGTRAAPAG